FAAPGSKKADRTRNQYGFTAGFPIVQNTLFGFASADLSALEGENDYFKDFILPSEINGPWLTRGNDTPANRAFIQSVIDRFPSTLTNNDPRSNRTFAGVAG